MEDKKDGEEEAVTIKVNNEDEMKKISMDCTVKDDKKGSDSYRQFVLSTYEFSLSKNAKTKEICHHIVMPGFNEHQETKQYIHQLNKNGLLSIPNEAKKLFESDYTVEEIDKSGVYQFTKLKNPNISEIKTRANIITSNRLKKSLYQKANYIISPDTMGCHWSSFEKAEELFQSGKVAVSENIQSLKEKIDINKIK